MPKVFNITGNCIPRLHYMVNLDSRLQAIRKLVDAEQYITINRGRQYGKTTTLKALAQYLSDSYYVLDMDFQTAMSGAAFQTEESFARAFVESFCFLFEMKETNGELDELLAAMQKAASEKIKLGQLFRFLAKICKAADKPIVLLIDEVDSASNNQVFLVFLAQIRWYYLNRDSVPTFHSVILAGVHDIRNLQIKIRPDAEHKHNSPWNIATALEIDMSFSPDDIAGMLRDYEADHNTGMVIAAISQMIYDYTSGYPVLVSMICKFIDEKADAVWTGESIAEAVKYIINEPTPLFESLINKIEDNPELCEMIYSMLFSGREYSFSVDNPTIRLTAMYGFVTKRGGQQLAEDLDYYHIDRGYLLSFNFNQNKQVGTRTVQVGDKTVFEAVV